MATILFLMAFFLVVPCSVIVSIAAVFFVADPVGMVREVKNKKQEYKEAWRMLKNKE